MIKKILFGGAALTTLAFVLMGPHAFHQVKRAFNWARDGVQDAIPIEAQLAEADELIDELEPEIRDCKRKVAEEDVEIGYLRKEIARLDRKLGRDAATIQASNQALKTQQVGYAMSGRNYSRQALGQRVRAALEKHKQQTALLASKRRLLDARERSFIAAQQRLEAVCTTRQNMRVKVEQLRAQLRETQAMEASTARFELDDSDLSDVKEILARCRKRLDVNRKLLEQEAPLSLDSMDAVPVEEVTQEVDRFFGQGAVDQPRAESRALVPVTGR